MAMDFQPIKPTPQLKYFEYLGSNTSSTDGQKTITHNKGKTYDGYILTCESATAVTQVTAYVRSKNTNALTFTLSGTGSQSTTVYAWGIVNAGF